jgi:hypothetical protein
MSINGPRVIFDPHTLEANEERPFAASRHRSKRIRKKLLKRFGGEFRNQPCMWFYCGTVFAHPSFRLSSRQLREVNYEQPNRQPAQGPHRPCALQGTGRAFHTGFLQRKSFPLSSRSFLRAKMSNSGLLSP